MKKLNLFFCVIILLNTTMFAQSQPDEPPIRGIEADISLLSINSGNLLDRGSAFVNSSFINGAVNVSDYSGNLTIGHSMDINYPNDLKTKLTLIFNSNACHAYFEDIVSRHPQTGGVADGDFIGVGARENSVNAALWIFGINGIALQTTNFEKNFFTGTSKFDSETNWVFSGTQVPLLATGYNYTNNLKISWYDEAKRMGTTQTCGSLITNKDAINLMNSEGSVISLRNIIMHTNDPSSPRFDDHLTGTYFDADEKSNGYAFVKWAKLTSGGEDTFGVREIYYKPGDGLTYYFKEDTVSYQDYKYRKNWSARLTNVPKIAYLDSIKSQNGDMIVFTYDYKNIFDTDTVKNGRKFLKTIQYYKNANTPVSGTEITFEYKYDSINGYRIIIVNTLANEIDTVKLYDNPYFTRKGFNTIDRAADSLSSIMQVSEIVNNNNPNKKSLFSYDDYIRRYTYGAIYQYDVKVGNTMVGPLYGTINSYFVQYPIKVCTSRTVNKGEQNVFSYYQDTELADSRLLYNPDSSYGVDFNKMKQVCSAYFPTNSTDTDKWQPVEYIDKEGYYINAYSNCPNLDYSSNRHQSPFNDYSNPDNIGICESLTDDWLRYFEGYHLRNMSKTMRDNYTAAMIKGINNSIYTEGNNYKPISKKEYIYSWNGKLFNEENNEINCSKYYDMSARITGISTKIITTNLDTGSDYAANKSYTEEKVYEQLKITSKFQPNLFNFMFDFNITSHLRPTSETVKDVNGNILQEVRYNYDPLQRSILRRKHVVGRAWQSFYDITSPTQLDLRSKEIYYQNELKATVYSGNSYDQAGFINRSGFNNPNYSGYFEKCMVSYIKTDSSTVEEKYPFNANPHRIKTSSYFNNNFGITLSKFSVDTKTGFNDISYVYRPQLPMETKISGQIGSGGWFQKSRKHIEYYPDTYSTYEKGRLWHEDNYGATDDSLLKTTYSYKSSGNYPGYLSKIELNNNSSTEFKYSGEINSVSGNLLCTDGSIINITHSYSNFQPQPFKTIKNYGAKSLETYTGYDGKGNLIFSLDANGYFSTFAYDGLGRIKKEFKPGSFNPNNPYLPLIPSYYDNSKGSTLYVYNDNLWTPEVSTTKYFNNSESDFSGIRTKTKFNPDLLAYENYAVDGRDTLKSREKINYLGKKIYSEDGMGRKAYYLYDNFLNLKETRFIANNSGSPNQKQAVRFDDPAYFKTIQIIDEEGNSQKNYYDLFNNIVKNVKANNYVTEFNFNNLLQLASVKSPMGKYTYYYYDNLGNINKRTSPDDGTYKYIYDKFGNLLVTSHTTAKTIVYNTYDQLNRLVSTGEKTYSGSEIPDTYKATVDNSELTLVNMYDDFSETGVFSGLNFPNASELTNLKGRLAATAYRDKPGDPWKYKIYSYDALGSVIKTYMKE